MNWITKIATPYLDTQPFQHKFILWENREKELELNKDALKREAEEIASRLGHQLRKWDYNSSSCTKCTRAVQITNIHGKSSINNPSHKGKGLLNQEREHWQHCCR